MIRENILLNSMKNITTNNILQFIKKIKIDMDIYDLYNKINTNNELLNALKEKIKIENKQQDIIREKMENEYIRVAKNIKNIKINTMDKRELNRSVTISSIYGMTSVLSMENKDIVLVSLPLERSSNCSYLFNEDNFCMSVTDLRNNYKNNRAIAYNIIELIKDNNLDNENIDYFNNYLENYEN